MYHSHEVETRSIKPHTVEKNRQLMNESEKLTPLENLIVPRPKGCVGSKGYSLIAMLGLDKDDDKDKRLFNDLKVSIKFRNQLRTHIDIRIRSMATGNRSTSRN